ncbi:MAG: insulinase family protein, partial [Chryseobacterium sp.]
MIKLTKVVIGLLFYIYFSGFAQNPIKTGSIPINPALKQGVLQNGLQYYIMRDTDNALNKGRIAMRLVVKAGNLHEDADQLDMGHLVEHIGMRSSENFPLGIMRYFNSLPKKVDIGASTNATTNYYLTIPSGDEALLNKGILAMHDCAGGMSMLPSEIEEERSAVYREYMNANTPAFLADVNLIYQQWDKNPVYKPRVLEVLQSVMNAPLSSMYRFYHDWYHPRYQAVIVVGDLDVVEVEHLIKKHLSSLSNEGIRPQKDVKRLYDIKLSGKDRLFISDKGKGRPGILIKVAKKSKHDVNLECPSTINEVKTILIYDLATKMLKYRMQSNPSLKQITLQVQTRAVANPYLSALYAESRVNQVSEIEPILLQVLREMRRVSLYGFSEPEFARARAIINAERQQTKVNYVTALLNCVECGTVFSDKDLSAKILSSISLSEINQTIVPRISQKGNTDFVLEGSETKSLKLPTEKEILSMLHTVSQEKLQPYIDPAIKELPAIVKGADLKDCKITEISGSGATKVLLPNGATVILKSLSEDQSHEQGISIRGFSKNVNEAITNDPELALLLILCLN